MSDLAARVLILIAACGIEAVLAYPAIVFGAIGHPVSWIGAAISALETRLNRPAYSAALRRVTGVMTVLLLVAVALGLGLALEMAVRSVPVVGFILAVLIVAAVIAAGSLDQH